MKRSIETIDQTYVWHPFTQMKQYTETKPLIIERGEGAYLIDVDGNRYLDGYASLWVNVHGHNDAAMNEAIIAQLGRIAHSTLLGAGNVPSSLLAKALVERAPGSLSKVFYSDTGSAAVEIALKMAYQYWKNEDPKRYEQRNLFVSLEGAYHGDTIGSISVGGVETFHGVFEPLLFETIQVPSPHPYAYESEDEAMRVSLEALEHVFQTYGERISAFIIEPLMQAAAGLIRHPDGYLKAVESLCRTYDILLIADEVAVGFGRTGTLFAVEREGVEPDLLCLGKGLTGGYVPLAVTMATDRIYNAFLGTGYDDRTFLHGHTYTGNQVTCTAALKNIELFDERNVLGHVRKTIERIQPSLRRLEALDVVGDVRAQGLMIGVELTSDRATKRVAPTVWAERVVEAMKERGIIIRNIGPVLTIVPVLMMAHDDVERILTTLYDVLAERTCG